MKHTFGIAAFILTITGCAANKSLLERDAIEMCGEGNYVVLHNEENVSVPYFTPSPRPTPVFYYDHRATVTCKGATK